MRLNFQNITNLQFMYSHIIECGYKSITSVHLKKSIEVNNLQIEISPTGLFSLQKMFTYMYNYYDSSIYRRISLCVQLAEDVHL